LADTQEEVRCMSMNRLNVDFLLILLAAGALCAQPQIGGGTCSNASFNGPYFWQLSGALVSAGVAVPAAELARIITDGNGAFSGTAEDVINGLASSHTLSGTYTIQSNCTGIFTISVDSQLVGQAAFQVVSGGRNGLMAFSTPTGLVTGTIFRQSADLATPCSLASISGSYGYLLTGFAGSSVFFDDGSVSADGNGNLTARSTVNLGGAISSAVATGTYTVTAGCAVGAHLTDQHGNTATYIAGIAEDGGVILFLRLDPTTTVSGAALPQSVAPQQAVVNGASFASHRLAPGSLFSIFGQGFSQQTASATKLPLPTTLGSTQVLINGQPIPLDYVSPTQINAQVPLETPVNTPVTIAVQNGAQHSNVAALNALAAAPGVFTYGSNHTIVQNQDQSLNSPTSPAHPGDIVVAYLTGGGSVRASGPWITGGPSPGGASPVTASYSVTIGGQQAQTSYIGLTPGFVGLYQANLTVPQLAPGNYPLVITINSVQSNGPMISVAK
jgi:uncharacterized protein (TIGR03437 family)